MCHKQLQERQLSNARQVQPCRLVGLLSWSEKIADLATGVVVLWGLKNFLLPLGASFLQLLPLDF